MKFLIISFIPPFFLKLIFRLLHKENSFIGHYDSWEEAKGNAIGYDASLIVEKVLDSTLKVKRGEAVFERDSVLFDKVEYSWPILTGLMMAASLSGRRLDVLDFGGALGSSYFQHKKILDVMGDVRWSIVEQDGFVSAGKQYVQDKTIRFYVSIGDCINDNTPNVVLLSSVLQYLESPYKLLSEIKITGATFLIIDRTPFSIKNEDSITVQHVSPVIYSASYPMRVFSLQKLINYLQKDWDLIEAYSSPEGRIQENGLDFTFKGMFFRLKND